MIEYQWLVEGRIVVFGGNGNISAEDIEKENEILTEFFEQGTGPLVHVIGDDRNLTEFPPLSTLLSVEWLQHEKLGFFIIVGMSNVIDRMKSHMATNKHQVRFRLVDTMEEALEILEFADPSLPRNLKAQIAEEYVNGAHLEKYD